MAENNNVLKLYKGEAHKIRVEKAEEFATSYFIDAYKQAMRCFHDIHVDNENTRKNKSNREFNNVIAFCGERGSGKTSAMMSFRNMLADWKNQHTHLSNWAGDGFAEKTPVGLRFVCLEAVDPSRFEPNDRLSGTVLSELYNIYAEKEGKEKHPHFEAQRDLEKSFSNLLKGIQLLSAKGQSPFGDPRSSDQDFEILAGIAGAAGLRKTFHELVGNYLRYELKLGAGGDLTNTYLVIPVDDLDLSVEHAFSLAEDIRKYLHVPNVIILIAMKLDQLRLSVEQANYVRFSQIRDQTQKPESKYIEEMSNMYLEKLIPISRRILLPIFGNIENAKRKNLYFGPRLVQVDEEKLQLNSAEGAILDLLKEKTLLDFRPELGIINPLVPKTLRELQNFLEFLAGLDTPVENDPTSFIEAIGKFQDYFFEFWIPNVLERTQEEVILKLKQSEYAVKNAIAVYHIGKIIHALWELFPKLPSKITEFEAIQSSEVHSFNVSLGDVLFLIDELKRIDRARQYQNFIFAVKAYYSVELVKLILGRKNDLVQRGQRTDLGDFLGGAFFHPKQFSFFTEPFKSAKTDNRYIFIPGYLPNAARENVRLRVKETLGFFDRIYTRHASHNLKQLTPHEQQETNFLAAVINSIAKKDSFAASRKALLEDIAAMRLLEGFMCFVYNSQIAMKPDYRNHPTRWYSQSTNLTGGRIPDYYIIDFKAFLFWILVPNLNRLRITSSTSSNDLEQEDGKAIEFESENPTQEFITEFELPHPRDKKGDTEVFLARVFQLDVITGICNSAQFIIDQRRRNTTYQRSFSIEMQDLFLGIEGGINSVFNTTTENDSGMNFNRFFPDLASASRKILALSKEVEARFFTSSSKIDEVVIPPLENKELEERLDSNTIIAIPLVAKATSTPELEAQIGNSTLESPYSRFIQELNEFLKQQIIHFSHLNSFREKLINHQFQTLPGSAEKIIRFETEKSVYIKSGVKQGTKRRWCQAILNFLLVEQKRFLASNSPK